MKIMHKYSILIEDDSNPKGGNCYKIHLHNFSKHNISANNLLNKLKAHISFFQIDENYQSSMYININSYTSSIINAFAKDRFRVYP